MFRADVRSWQWSGTSAQQSVGDHVKTAASGPGDQRNVHGRPREAFREIARDTEFGCCRCAGLLFHPSSIDKEAGGNRDTSFQNVTKCDADLCKNLYASVMVTDGAAMFEEIGEYTAEDGTWAKTGFFQQQ